MSPGRAIADAATAERRGTGVTRTLLLSEHDLGRWRRDYASGRRSSPLPYGVDALAERGYLLRGVGRSGADGPFARVRDAVEHRLGYPVERAVRGMRRAASADLVLALLESQGRAPAALKRRGLPPYAGTPLVLWTVWLAEILRAADADERRAWARRLDHVDLLVHLSAGQREVFLASGFPAERLASTTFGVAADYYAPGDAERDLDIVAIGQDAGRDYGTLIRAVAGTGMRVRLVCRPENLVGLSIPDEVEIVGTVGHDEYRRLLQRAKVVAVPTRDLAYPTGSSVALEASAAGACVVATGTAALREYVADDRALLVPVGDAGAWRETLERALGDDALRAQLGAAARAAVLERYDSRAVWGELDEALRARGLVAGDRTGGNRS